MCSIKDDVLLIKIGRQELMKPVQAVFTCATSVQVFNSADGFIPRRCPRFIGCENTAETNVQASVQLSSSAGGFIPRRSPRFIGCGNTTESLDHGNVVVSKFSFRT
ncbi:hypothetical protein MKX03_030818 [Papaver bracteatum]|nr:hypothetical protein MKX03_030818 [Papaver bracteatum]